MTKQDLTDTTLTQLLNSFRVSKDEGDVWVFGYGSLMWKPDLAYDDIQHATALGYHRRFNIKCNHHRGSNAHMGRVLGLEAGGECDGILYRLSKEELVESLQNLWAREMWVEDAYTPKRISTIIDKDMSRQIYACTFIATPDTQYYDADNCLETKATTILKAKGQSGTNFDYLENTCLRLRSLGIHDTHIEELYAITLKQKALL